jgi:hypothetical protein
LGRAKQAAQRRNNIDATCTRSQTTVFHGEDE